MVRVVPLKLRVGGSAAVDADPAVKATAKFEIPDIPALALPELATRLFPFPELSTHGGLPLSSRCHWPRRIELGIRLVAADQPLAAVQRRGMGGTSPEGT